MRIWAHTLVRNEERYLWYSVMSVVDHVDKVLLWDTGSTDNTPKIIKALQKERPGKIELVDVGPVDIEEFTKVRQKMLDKTEADWVVLVDGDEVWWEDSIKMIVEAINKEGEKLETIFNPYYNIVGDIYHYQEKEAGRYEIDGRRGHLTIRTMNRKIPGLHIEKPHGQQGFFDKDGKLVQERSAKKRKFLDVKYLHFTHVVRSSSRQEDLSVPKRDMKYKYELGVPFPPDFYYPEVFFRPKPSFVYTPWEKIQGEEKIKAFTQTPLRKLKRRILLGKSGY